MIMWPQAGAFCSSSCCVPAWQSIACLVFTFSDGSHHELSLKAVFPQRIANETKAASRFDIKHPMLGICTCRNVHKSVCPSTYLPAFLDVCTRSCPRATKQERFLKDLQSGKSTCMCFMRNGPAYEISETFAQYSCHVVSAALYLCLCTGTGVAFM